MAEEAFAAQNGIHIDDPYILRLALTHRSVLNDWQNVPHLDARLESNERLEFLGDAVLGAIAADYVYRHDPSADEGALTRLRTAMVRAETLVRWSRELGIPDVLYLGTGESFTEGARDRKLAGAFEALVGAIYLDQGPATAGAFVWRFLERDGETIRSAESDANPKGRLQEILQEQAIPGPTYVTIVATGPDHAREFTEAVVVNGEQLGVGTGRSKRVAQQEAARRAIVALGQADS